MKVFVLISWLVIPFGGGFSQGYLLLVNEDIYWPNHNYLPEFIYLPENALNQIEVFEAQNIVDERFAVFNNGLLDRFLYNPITYNLLINKGVRISNSASNSLYCCEYGDTRKYGMTDDSLLLTYIQTSNRLIAFEEFEPYTEFWVRFKKKRQAYKLFITAVKVKEFTYCECYSPQDRDSIRIPYAYPKVIGDFKALSSAEVEQLTLFLNQVGDLFRRKRVKLLTNKDQ